MNNVYGVVFKDKGKVYFFKSEENFKINTYVIVETEKGLQFAKIVSLLDKNQDMEYKKIIRVASDEDYNNHLRNLKDADKAFRKCVQLVKDLGLKMKITSTSYTFDRNQLLFNFTADDRIDFRELAKKLAGLYHTRIELRQIGARDKAKEIGGIGICGKKLCCANFLNQIDGISMNMAKNQSLALNPSKINGACGRLLCCLAYEDENYLESSKGLPSAGDYIKTSKGNGIVESVDVLNRKYKVNINGNKEEFYADENSKK